MIHTIAALTNIPASDIRAVIAKNRKGLLYCLPLCLAMTFAEAKPLIDFRFAINEPLLELIFIDNKDSVENEIAKRLIPFLNEYLCFAQFEQNDQLENHFTVILDNINRSDDFTKPQDVVFFFELTGQNVKPHESAETWLFINKSSYSHPQGNVEAFTGKVVAAFVGKLKYNYQALVEKIFCNLVITNQGVFRRSQLEWVLPLTSNDLGVDIESLFEIINEARDVAGVLECSYKAVMIGYYTGLDLPEDYRMGIRVKNSESRDLCEIFTNNSLNVKVKEVLLKSFRRSLSSGIDPVLYVPTENPN